MILYAYAIDPDPAPPPDDANDDAPYDILWS